MMYGQTNVFAIDLPWDHSRTDQYLGTGDGTKVDFVAIRDWASGQYGTAQPVGMIDRIQNIKFNGTIQGSNTYSNTRSLVTFVDPPHPNVVITMTFTYFYICRFTEDEQDFEEFSKNRWRVPSLKFRAVYWPGCQ
jgi:hypothetical protein